MHRVLAPPPAWLQPPPQTVPYYILTLYLSPPPLGPGKNSCDDKFGGLSVGAGLADYNPVRGMCSRLQPVCVGGETQVPHVVIVLYPHGEKTIYNYTTT